MRVILVVVGAWLFLSVPMAIGIGRCLKYGHRQTPWTKHVLREAEHDQQRWRGDAA